MSNTGLSGSGASFTVSLKKLDEHNAERRAAHRVSDRPWRNGIGCPSCGAELFDSSPMTTLTSDPPQKNIHCDHCGYCGYRVV